MILALLLACASAPSPAPRTLTVLAASSLTEAFGDLEADFEAAHAGVDVVLSFAGSQALATQVRHGVRADVVASADAAHAEALAAEGLVSTPRAFAGNALVLALAAEAPAVTLETLPEVGSLVLGAPEVPVGRYTDALLEAAAARYGAGWREAVEARVVSREGNVRLVLSKVALGEADAAVVYATDLAAGEGVRGVELPAELAPRSRYLHAALVDAPAPTLAAAWLALVESPQGQARLAAHGFLPAP